MTSGEASQEQDDRQAAIAFMDFVRATRTFATGDPGGALLSLFPPRLVTEHQVHRRVHVMVAAGALIAGSIRRVVDDISREPPPLGRTRIEELAAQFVQAGADLDAAADRIRELIAAHRTAASNDVDETLTDVAVELVSGCAPHAGDWGGQDG